MSQLEAYVAQCGPVIRVRGRTFHVSGVDGEGDTTVATFVTTRSRYHGVRCVYARVAGRPAAEVWSLIAGRREFARFAIHDGSLLELS